MNTHDIELPPLPPLMGYAAGSGHFKHVQAIQEYAKEYARSAINAYRKHRFLNGDALQQYNEFSGDDESDPIERLRFYCSLAMSGQDWLDSEQFFDDLLAHRKRLTPPNEQFAIVIDRLYEGEGPSLACWNGENYQFSDGDCYERVDNTLDGCTAEFLTDHQLEKRLFDNRQRWGEPVAWVAFADNGNIRIWTAKKGEAEQLSEQVGQPLIPFYTAPQPAEPVKVPSNDDIRRVARDMYLAGELVWLGFDKDKNGEYTQPTITNSDITLIRALFARYGQPTVPEGWQLVPKEPAEEMLIAAMEASVLGRPSADDESYVRSIVAAWCDAAPKFGEEE